MKRRALTLFELLLVSVLLSVMAGVLFRFVSSFARLSATTVPQSSLDRAMADALIRDVSQGTVAVPDRSIGLRSAAAWAFVAADTEGTAFVRFSFSGEGLMYERTPYPIAFGASPIRRLVLPGAKGSFRYACRGSTDKEYAWTIPGSFGSSVCVAAQLTVMTSDGGSDVFAYDPPLMKKVR